MTDFSLKLINLSAAYGTQTILHNISFTLGAGQIIGLAGSSGSGKTTLLNALACTLPANARLDGALYWQQINLLQQPSLHRKLRGSQITMLPQNAGAAFFPLLTIKKQLSVMLQAHGLQQQNDIQDKITAAMQSLHLANYPQLLNSYPYQLSGGTLQRLFLAFCLLLKPKLLLADEPTAGLDVLAQAKLLKLLKALPQHTGTTMLITSHNLGFLSELADTLLIMQQGKIIEAGPASFICSNPQTAYTKQLLAALPSFAKENSYAHPNS